MGGGANKLELKVIGVLPEEGRKREEWEHGSRIEEGMASVVKD